MNTLNVNETDGKTKNARLDKKDKLRNKGVSNSGKMDQMGLVSILSLPVTI